MQREVNPSKEYLRVNRLVLSKIDVVTTNQEDIAKYLDSLRKPEAVDPLHKWIGTYNLYVIILKRFFKWFTHSKNPHCMEGIKKLRRKETSIYSASDLWTQDDDLLFLKYCPSKRDKFIDPKLKKIILENGKEKQNVSYTMELIDKPTKWYLQGQKVKASTWYRYTASNDNEYYEWGLVRIVKVINNLLRLGCIIKEVVQ